MRHRLLRGFSAVGFQTANRFRGLPAHLLYAVTSMLSSAEAVARERIGAALPTPRPCASAPTDEEERCLAEAEQWEANGIYGFLQVLQAP